MQHRLMISSPMPFAVILSTAEAVIQSPNGNDVPLLRGARRTWDCFSADSEAVPHPCFRYVRTTPPRPKTLIERYDVCNRFRSGLPPDGLGDGLGTSRK